VYSPAPLDVQRTPSPAGAPARHERHAIGNDECRVEADAELADQLRVLARFARERFEKALRARASDRADVLDDFLARHADAVVANGQRLRFLVGRDLDAQFRIVGRQRGIGERRETQLVAGVGSVRDQLAKEDFLVRIQRMRDEVEDLGDFGLEGSGFGSGRHENLGSNG
jgi:hypothetical protein